MVVCTDKIEREFARRLVVRLMRAEERAEFDRLLKEKHYLGSAIKLGALLRTH